METICPYCGHQFDSDAAASGLTPATCICPSCEHELDRPGAAAPPPPPPPPPPGTGPSAGAGEGTAALGPGPAWEQEAGGFFTRLWQTLVQVLMHPVITLGAPARPGLGYPLGFGLILGTLGSVMMGFWNSILEPESAASSLLGGSPVLILVLSPILVLIQLFIVAALAHFFLWVVRGASKGYSDTFRVVAYSSAANVFLCLPFLGTAISSVWSLVIIVGGLAVVHGTSRGRVVLALLIPVVLVIILTILGVSAVLS